MAMEGLLRLMLGNTPALQVPTAGSALWQAVRCFSVLAQAQPSLSQPGQASSSSIGSTSSLETTSLAASRSPKPELVEQFLAAHNMRSGEAAKVYKSSIMQQFQRHDGDVGSPEVTIALWTHEIRRKAQYFHSNPKDFMNTRALEMLVARRRRMLAWLRSADFQAYSLCISQLGLNDVFGKQHKADRYHVGVPHGQPAPGPSQDAIRRLRFAFHREYKQKKTSQWKRLLPMLMSEDPLLPKASESSVPGSVQQLAPGARQ